MMVLNCLSLSRHQWFVALLWISLVWHEVKASYSWMLVGSQLVNPVISSISPNDPIRNPWVQDNFNPVQKEEESFNQINIASSSIGKKVEKILTRFQDLFSKKRKTQNLVGPSYKLSDQITTGSSSENAAKTNISIDLLEENNSSNPKVIEKDQLYSLASNGLESLYSKLDIYVGKSKLFKESASGLLDDFKNPRKDPFKLPSSTTRKQLNGLLASEISILMTALEGFVKSNPAIFESFLNHAYQPNRSEDHSLNPPLKNQMDGNVLKLIKELVDDLKGSKLNITFEKLVMITHGLENHMREIIKLNEKDANKRKPNLNTSLTKDQNKATALDTEQFKFKSNSPNTKQIKGTSLIKEPNKANSLSKEKNKATSLTSKEITPSSSETTLDKDEQNLKSKPRTYSNLEEENSVYSDIKPSNRSDPKPNSNTEKTINSNKPILDPDQIATEPEDRRDSKDSKAYKKSNSSETNEDVREPGQGRPKSPEIFQKPIRFKEDEETHNTLNKEKNHKKNKSNETNQSNIDSEEENQNEFKESKSGKEKDNHNSNKNEGKSEQEQDGHDKSQTDENLKGKEDRDKRSDARLSTSKQDSQTRISNSNTNSKNDLTSSKPNYGDSSGDGNSSGKNPLGTLLDIGTGITVGAAGAAGGVGTAGVAGGAGVLGGAGVTGVSGGLGALGGSGVAGVSGGLGAATNAAGSGAAGIGETANAIDKVAKIGETAQKLEKALENTDKLRKSNPRRGNNRRSKKKKDEDGERPDEDFDDPFDDEEDDEQDNDQVESSKVSSKKNGTIVDLSATKTQKKPVNLDATSPTELKTDINLPQNSIEIHKNNSRPDNRPRNPESINLEATIHQPYTKPTISVPPALPKLLNRSSNPIPNDQHIPPTHLHDCPPIPPINPQIPHLFPQFQRYPLLTKIHYPILQLLTNLLTSSPYIYHLHPHHHLKVGDLLFLYPSKSKSDYQPEVAYLTKVGKESSCISFYHPVNGKVEKGRVENKVIKLAITHQ